MVIRIEHVSVDGEQTTKGGMGGAPAGTGEAPGAGAAGAAGDGVAAASAAPAWCRGRSPVTVSATATASTMAHPATIRQRLDSGSRKSRPRFGSRPWLITSTDARSGQTIRLASAGT
jgi:hypothetical protein